MGDLLDELLGGPTAALALAGVLHAGFQLTVTALVYPALGDLAAEGWQRAHARHSRRITPLVVVVYGVLVAAGAWALAAGPGPGEWVALAGAAGAVVVTAVAAAPTHGRLQRHDVALVRRLLVADRVRCACAVVGAVAGVVALG